MPAGRISRFACEPKEGDRYWIAFLNMVNHVSCLVAATAGFKSLMYISDLLYAITPQNVLLASGHAYSLILFNFKVLPVWNRLPREVIDALSFQTFKVWLDWALSIWLSCRCSCSLQGVGPDGFKGPFQIKQFDDSMILTTDFCFNPLHRERGTEPFDCLIDFCSFWATEG